MLPVKRSKVAILGGGSWGTTTASVISRHCDTTLWARDGQIVDEINQAHTNHRYLGDAALNAKLAAKEVLGKGGSAVKDYDLKSTSRNIMRKHSCSKGPL